MISTSYTAEDLLLKQRSEFLGFKKLPYVQRARESDLRRHAESPLIKVVMGPRRAGKSRLIQKVLEEKQVAYINFEDEHIQRLSGESLIAAVETVYPNATHWYLDEVQDFPHWENLINKLHRRRFNLFVTGSNANLLSTELATALTGRHVPIELLPFSYAEFCQATTSESSWESFQTYLTFGGFPEVVIGSASDKNSYLSALFDAVVLKDLIKRKKIRTPSFLTNCTSLLIDNITARLSARSVSRALNGSPSAVTVEKYFSMLCEAYLIEQLSTFSAKPKERIRSERKPYAIDTGLITAKAQGVFPLLGKQLENAIYLELRRRGHTPQHSLYFYRSADGKEVDFLLRNGHKTTELLQVCLDLTSIETREREIHALKVAQKEHPEAKLTIVTAQESGTITLENGSKVTLVPAWQFCG
jgi:predicted AAA+ superfamily ATPase